jgi:hypothetical protein
MAFQFLCPAGHLLEGEESQMGQPCPCPVCGIEFIIPVLERPVLERPVLERPVLERPVLERPVLEGPVVAGASAAAAAASAPGPAAGRPDAVAGPPEPFPQVGPDAGGAPAADRAAVAGKRPSPAQPADENKDEAEQLVHIPCPQGHELETPLSMLGMEVMCPQCQSQFTLRYEESVEHARERELARQRREELFNQRLIRWSIVAAAVVVLGVATLLVLSAMD